KRVDTTGNADSPQNWAPIAGKTTVDVSYENAMGCAVREENGIATGASTPEYFGNTAYTRNDEGKVTSAARDGRGIYDATWQGPRVLTSKGEEGEEITYSQFDYDHRPQRAVTAGFAGDGAEAPARLGMQTDVTYDSLGR